MCQNNEEAKRALEERLKNCEKIESVIKDAVKAAPHIEHTKELTIWQMETLSKFPNVNTYEQPKEIVETIKYENAVFIQQYGHFIQGATGEQGYSGVPGMQGVLGFRTYSDIGVSGCSGTYDHLAKVSSSQDYRNNNYSFASEQKTTYETLAKNQEREKEVEAFIRKVKPELGDIFHEIVADSERVKLEITKIPDLVIRMRTLMEKIKGEFGAKLRIMPSKNQIWQEVGNIYVDSNPTSSRYLLFKAAYEKFYDLHHNVLTQIGKWNVNQGSPNLDFQTVYVDYIDNLYSILSMLSAVFP